MDADTGASDRALWAAAVRGDARAFGSVFDRHYRPVLAYCGRITADQGSAEDVASMVFLEAWRHRRKVVVDEEASIRPWLLGIASNLARNANRAYRRYGAFLVKLPLSGIDESAENIATDRMDRDEQRSLVQRVIADLPAALRDVVTLCDLRGLTHDEAARELGVSVRTLRRRLAEARSLIRKVHTDPRPSSVPNQRDHSDKVVTNNE